MNIVKATDRSLDAVNTFMEYVMGGIFLVLVIVTFQEVFRRYLFNDPTPWASELSRFLLIWMTFTGAGIVTRQLTHLTMGFTIHRFVSKNIGKAIKIFISAASLIGLLCLTYYSGKVTFLAGYRSAPMTGVPMYIPWSALPFNGAIMALYLLAELVKNVVTKEDEAIL